MKSVYVYSRHVAAELELINTVQAENPTHLIIIELDDCPEPFRSCIKETPAFIPITDDLQGLFLLDTGVDGKLILTATLLKRASDEELVIHNKDTKRIDKYIEKLIEEAKNEVI